MKLLADECCDAGLVTALRAAGHDVIYIPETLKGAVDEAVLERAHSDRRILLTEDKDFGELAYRLRKPAFGIVLLRFAITNRHLKLPRLTTLLRRCPERLAGHFVVVSEHLYRFRALL